MADPKKKRKLSDEVRYLGADDEVGVAARPPDMDDADWAQVKALYRKKRAKAEGPKTIANVGYVDGKKSLQPPKDDESIAYDDDNGPYLVTRNGINQEKWDKLVSDAKKNPKYLGYYNKGEETHSNYQHAYETSALPKDDDSVVFQDKKTGKNRVVVRNQTAYDVWHQFRQSSEKDPDYVASYENGELAHSREIAEEGEAHEADAKHYDAVQNDMKQAKGELANEKSGEGSGVGGFFKKALLGAATNALPEAAAEQPDKEATKRAAGSPNDTRGMGEKALDVAKSAGKGFLEAAVPALPAAEALMSPNLAPTIQNVGAAAGSVAKAGIGAVGEGLSSAGMPNVGNAVSGVAEGIKPQPNLSGIPPMMRPGAQAAVDQQNGGPVDPALPQMRGAQPPAALPMESESVSMKTKGPTGAAVQQPGAPTMDPNALDQSFDAAKAANQSAFDAQLDQSKKVDEIRRENVSRAERFEADRVEKENYVKQNVDRARMAHDHVIMQMERPIARIDPGRYWSNAGAASNALTIIASFFAGLAGKGEQFLARLDNLVDQDVRAQQANIENGERRLNQKEASTRSAYAMAREAGLDQNASLATARDALYKSMQMQLEAQVAAVPDPVKRAELMKVNLALEQSREKAKMDLKSALAEDSLRRAQAFGIYQHARNESAELEVKRIKAQKGIKEDKMPPGEQSKLSSATGGMELLPELKKAIGDGSLSSAFTDELMKRIPGTDAAKRNRSAKLLGRAIFAGLDKSVVNAHDQEFLDKLQSGVGLQSLSQGDIDAFMAELKSQYNSTLRTADQLGQQTGTLREVGNESIPGERAR